ncbi:TetR/AcrR family transcriptional regulator [Nonomuraea sp. C10]|uniref:TetR/AcrR family transcriptional regulator n=1 Tax=Nonomuraea sp. C10 TaxID=2600577 RepID=UPI0011CDAEE9|nr:TetR/AcrR family transcriptional regulator [Nonomuraea sp. C10]TXK41367.1 TetR/AcrR family transcriptional regulator [Nonomuraea sp. C10]
MSMKTADRVAEPACTILAAEGVEAATMRRRLTPSASRPWRSTSTTPNCEALLAAVADRALRTRGELGRARRFPDGFRDGASPSFTKIVTLVEEGMRDGLLRPDDPLEVAMTVTATAQGLVQLYLGGRIGLAEDEFRALCTRATRRVLDGVRA